MAGLSTCQLHHEFVHTRTNPRKKVVQKSYYFFCQIGQELFEYQHPMVQIRAPAPYHCKNYDLLHDLDGTQKLLDGRIVSASETKTLEYFVHVKI